MESKRAGSSRDLARTCPLRGQPKLPLLDFIPSQCPGSEAISSQTPAQLIQLIIWEKISPHGKTDHGWAMSLACLDHQGKGLISQVVIPKIAYSSGDVLISEYGLTFILKR